MHPFETFIWAFAGSLSVEVVRLYWYVNKNPAGCISGRYSTIAFWMVLGLLAATAGIIAMAYEVQQPKTAMHIGMAAPVIIQELSKRSPWLLQ